MHLRLSRELSPAKFAELGKPSDAWSRADGQVVAMASVMPLLYWPGRAVYEGHRVRYRLSLYGGALESRLAVFDGARYPINAVAFHPTRPLIAIGTGTYDGGYCFEGELWLYNWESGEARSLLGELREVAACRWVDEERLAVLLRPRDEEEYPGAHDPFETYVGVVLEDLRDVRASQARGATVAFAADPRLADLQPIDPASLGFASPAHFSERRFRFDEVMASLDFEERSRVWDLMWLSPELLAVTHDQCHVEVWNTRTGERALHVQGEGHGVQLIRALGSTLVHVYRDANSIEESGPRSVLYRLEPGSHKALTRLRAFENTVVLSGDDSGNLLCRDPGNHRSRDHKRRDRVLNAKGEEVVARDLGHYDCFNHYMRLDGQRGLYFLRGTPASSHEHKRLCRVHLDGTVEEVMKWDEARSHLMNSVACWVSPQAIVRVCKEHHPRPGAGSKFIERWELGAEEPTWKRTVDAPATAIISVCDGVLFALTNGALEFLDATTGEVRWTTMLEVDGVATFATSLASQQEHIAVGTVDGRVLLFEHRPFRELE